MSGITLDRVSLVIHWNAFGSQCNPLINSDIVTNSACLTNDDTCAMIDEKMIFNLCAGMYIDASCSVCVFRYDSWD